MGKNFQKFILLKYYQKNKCENEPEILLLGSFQF